MSNSNLEPELNSLLSKLTIEIENDSKEIEIRKKRMEKNEALLRAVRASLGVMHSDAKPTGYGAKSEIIRDAINRIPKAQFTQDDVEVEIRRTSPAMEVNRSHLRSALWTMADKKRIRLIRKGTNQEPALYEKTDAITHLLRVLEPNTNQTLKHSGPAQLTAALLEDSVRSKSGRIDDLARRLNTDEANVRGLLEPASKVYVASAGWLKVRE
jgi:hypothetical protein